MTVSDLIDYLRTQPQDLLVCYACHSEYCLLEVGDVFVHEACEPRADGWVQRKRPDMPVRKYLALPGN